MYTHEIICLATQLKFARLTTEDEILLDFAPLSSSSRQRAAKASSDEGNEDENHPRKNTWVWVKRNLISSFWSFRFNVSMFRLCFSTHFSSNLPSPSFVASRRRRLLLAPARLTGLIIDNARGAAAAAAWRHNNHEYGGDFKWRAVGLQEAEESR